MARKTLNVGSHLVQIAMQNNVTLTEDDEGKSVINNSGETLGRVIKVEHGTAHVKPDPGLTDTIKSKLGWAESDEDTYELDASNVESVSDDEIHLTR